jgi:hypothetical protein
MGLFDDLMYPDNKNRALRASQLGQDCGDLASAIATDKESIIAALANANQVIKNTYESLAQSGVKYSDVTIDESWVADVVEVIAPLVSAKVATDALYVAARAWLLRQGRIGEAAFADLVGLPRWLTVGKVMGGVAAAVGVEAIIDSIEGAVQRSKLQDAIHSLIQPRIKIKRNAMINARVLLSLQSVIAAYQAISGIPGVSFTKAQLDAIAQNLVNQNTVDINSMDDDAARAALARLDRDRGAWTNEDN